MVPPASGHPSAGRGHPVRIFARLPARIPGTSTLIDPLAGCAALRIISAPQPDRALPLPPQANPLDAPFADSSTTDDVAGTVPARRTQQAQNHAPPGEGAGNAHPRRLDTTPDDETNALTDGRSHPLDRQRLRAMTGRACTATSDGSHGAGIRYASAPGGSRPIPALRSSRRPQALSLACGHPQNRARPGAPQAAVRRGDAQVEAMPTRRPTPDASG